MIVVAFLAVVVTFVGFFIALRRGLRAAQRDEPAHASDDDARHG